MLEMDSVGIAFLIRQTADFLQDGKMMADGIYRVPFFFRGESLIVMDELLRQLPESQILDLVAMFDELSKCQTHIVIARIGPFRTVYADTCLEVVTDSIRHFHECHLCFHTALKEVFHIGGIEINIAAHKVVESGVYRQQ